MANEAVAPVLATASVAADGGSVVLTFTEAGSPPLLPASSITGFSLTVGGISRSISSASRTASLTITLVVSSTIYIGQTVLVSYSAGNVTDSADTPNSLATITNSAVTNSSTVDGTAPVIATKTVAANGLSVVVTFTEASSPPMLPASSVTGFSLTVDGVARTISSASRTASLTITLVVSSAINTGQTVLLSYSAGNVTDSASIPNSLATVTDSAVTNSSAIDGTGPVIASAAVTVTGRTITVTVTEATSAPLLPATGITGFSVFEGIKNKVILSATRTASTTITLTLEDPILSTSTVLLCYSGGNVTDSYATPNSMSSTTNLSVTNNSLFEITRNVPTISFRVRMYDEREIYRNTSSDNLTRTLYNLEHATISVPDAPEQFYKHGDTFTMYGQPALNAKKNFITNLTYPLLVIVSSTP